MQPYSELEALSATHYVNFFALSTTDPLARVMQPGYLNRFCERGLRPLDRVLVTANTKSPADAELAELLVVSNAKGVVVTRLLTGARA